MTNAARGAGRARKPGRAGGARPLLATRRGRVVGALIALVVLVAGALIATARGTESSAPPTTTTTAPTTTTTAPPTTTTAPPPPPTWPLTGMPLADPAAAGRPTLVVKIDNVEPKSRPQIGLNQADVVYEERVEGAVTRFMAVFHSHNSMPIGPVRSARTSDIGLYQPLGRPLFAWSGANAIFVDRLRSAGGFIDVGYDVAPRFYSRAGNRAAPHNLMIRSAGTVWANRFPGATPPSTPLFSYRARGESPRGGRAVRGIRIVFATGAGSAPVQYVWNGRGWARSQNGSPHVDAEGVQIAPENVIVSYTPYASSGVNDQFGVPIREARLIGQGHALVLTSGRAIAARWTKPRPNAPTQYTDMAGNPIRLTPGRTWVALPEPGTTVFI